MKKGFMLIRYTHFFCIEFSVCLLFSYLLSRLPSASFNLLLDLKSIMVIVNKVSWKKLALGLKRLFDGYSDYKHKVLNLYPWKSKRLQTVVPFVIQGDIRGCQESLGTTNLTYTIRYLKVKG